MRCRIEEGEFMNRLSFRIWTHLDLAARLSLIVALSIIIVAIGTAYQTSQHLVQNTQADLSEDYNQQMDMLESVILAASFDEGTSAPSFDLERLADMIAQFKYRRDVSKISFRDTSEVAAFTQDITVKLEAPLFFSRWCGLETININRPIIVEGVYYGLLSLSMSPNRIINEAWKSYKHLMRVIFTSLALVLFSIWIVLRKSLRPMLALEAASRTIARGDLSVRVPVAGGPEMRTVLLTFNHMASSFQSALTALQESESRFRQLAESVPQLIWTCQPDGSCDYLSRQWIEYTGVPKARQLGSGWLEQIHPDDRAPNMAAAVEATTSGADYRVEIRIRRHDGEYRWFDTRATRLLDAQGLVVKWFGSNTDIHERKQAAEALRLKAEALCASNDELERFNRAAVGRELRMIELKQEINELCHRLGEPPRHAMNRLHTVIVPGADAAPGTPSGGGA
jgi:PAS domain S-box-containing protein